ncbi:MAG TPA: dTMP kinase [Candidatus Bathyarchaeia archaeon]|nr:dTMP kinase [Candidatus Bathyarchaeia archaeon]
MIIVIEGFDQAGKKTQSKYLATFLRKKKIKSKIFSFPDYGTPLGKEIKHYLSGNRKFPPQVIHCLLAANRWERSKEIRKAISEKFIVIMNRYYQSNLVYGNVNGLDMKWLENLDKGLPKEDLVILLDVNPNVSFSRKKEKRDKFEKNKEFAQKITRTYKKLAKKFGWYIVNASRDKQEVHKEIKQIVSKYIKK